MIQKEELSSFKDLASKRLRIGCNKPASVSMMHRWRNQGLADGIKLEAVKKDGVWCTSIEAFERFKNAVTVSRGLRAINQAKRPSGRRQPKTVGDKLIKMVERLSRAQSR